MKKLFSIFCMAFIFIGSMLQAQTVGQSFTEIFDNLFVNINKDDVRTNILYDRVVPFSKLTDFSTSAVQQYRTADANTFIQGFDELWHAAYLPSVRLPISTEELSAAIALDDAVVPIGLLHYKFNVIDSAVASQKLYITTDTLLAENTHIFNSLFKETTILMVSPLVQQIYNAEVNYRFQDFFRFDNTSNPIVKVQADFGDGNGFTSVDLNALYMIHYADTGEYTLTFSITFQNRTEVTTYAKIKYYSEDKSKFIGSGWPNIDKLIGTSAITAQIDFMDYQGHNAGKNKGNVWIYYAHTDKKLRKPVLIVDGFDPGNKRNFESCVGSGKSIWEQLFYVSGGNMQHLGLQLLQILGYDLVVLDLPDGGGYIEKNAMVCIETINYINAKLQLNGSKEQIVVVGPSMGGQITRYAMAYMEQHPTDPKCNYGKHNCRLWVSYDSPHQGANISYGAQELLYYFGHNLSNQAAKKTWNEVLNCVAAKQMLIYHKSPDALTYHERYYNRLENIGYPNALRKIAVSNGSINSVGNGTAGSTAFEALYPYVFFNIDAIVRRYPSSGQTVDVFECTWFILGIPFIIKRPATAPNNGFCGIDGAPGGTYNTYDQLAENMSGSVIIKNEHNHCFMPVGSTLDVSGNPNYCTNYSGRNLVNEGATPFASYCNIVVQNMAHVTFNQSIVNYLTNEIETYIQGKDSLFVCDEEVFTMHLPANQQNATVTWECSNNLLIVAGQGTSTVVIRCLSRNGNSWVCATASNLTYNKKVAKYKIVTMERVSLIPSPGSYSISQNSVWSTPLQLNENVIINNGATLSVATNLYFNPNVSIIVKQGGLLELDGALLTNSCGNILWEGIVVEGNGNGNHPSNGKVHLSNGSIIKNAKCGIRTGGNTKGGFIHGNDVTFINNKQAVVIASQLDENITENNNSSFDHCHFIAEENSFIEGLVINKQIELKSVKGVNFRDCHFMNHNSQDLVTAIFAVNSGFNVVAICDLYDMMTNTCIDGYLHQSTFTGFDHAIEAVGTATNASLRVVDAIFENNNVAIETNAVNNIYVVKNEFVLQGSTIDEFGYGVKLFESTGFTIEENIFHTSANNRSQNVGLSISNSRANNNVVYKNEFSNLSTAQEFVGQNRGNNSYLGLQTLCNSHFDNLKQDINVLIDPNNTAINGIRAFQGGQLVNNLLIDMPAGNVFSASVRRRILNATESSINYQYNSSHSLEIPTPSVDVVLCPVSTENACPSHFNTGGGTEDVVVKSNYLNANRFYQTALQACQWMLLSGNDNKIKEAEQQIATASAQRDYALNQYIQWLLHDSENHSQTVNQLLLERGSYSDLLSLAERAIVENRFADAITAANLLNTLEELTQQEREGINDFIEYIKYREDLYLNGKNIYELDLEDIDQLIAFSNSHFGRSKILVDNILCYLYQVCSETIDNNDDFYTSKSISSIKKNSIVEEDVVKISPNPTDSYCKFEWNFKEIKGEIRLNIYDNNGKNLFSNTLKGEIGEWIWNVNTVASGDYFYGFYNNNNLLKSGTIVVK